MTSRFDVMDGGRLSPLEAARDWTRRGYRVVPIPTRSKRPTILGWTDLRLEAEDLAKYFDTRPKNIGVLLGDDYGSADVDLDCYETVSLWPQFAPETGLVFGRQSKPASHFFYRADPAVPSRKYENIDGKTLIELRCLTKDGAVGLQTIVPYSLHQETGEVIRFEPGKDGDPANIDSDVLIRAVDKTAAAAILARNWPKSGHGRHACELALAGVLARSGWPVEDAKHFLVATYCAVAGPDRSKIGRVETSVEDTFRRKSADAPLTGIPRLSELIDKRAVDKALQWLGKAERDCETPNLLHFGWNDHGSAERLIALHGEDLRYCHSMKKWLVWDGRRWAIDETNHARILAQNTMLEFLRQATTAGNEDAAKFARRCLNSGRLTSALLEAEAKICVTPAQMDTNPDLLNFLNGTVDLQTSKLHPHDRKDLITKIVHYDYQPGAPCKRWLSFLDEVMGGGADASEANLDRAGRMVQYLQRAFGYSLTARTSEKAVFVLVGELGDNGKSTMLYTFRSLIEEYSALLQVDTLMTRQESSNTQADLANLRGARFAQTSETEEGQRFAQSKLKRITQGMGKISAVRKYENPIEFNETHKLWIDTNRKPGIADADDKATFARLNPIPFLVRIPKDRIDRELPQKLRAEAPGILAWAVEGAREWYKNGLQRPVEVDAAQQEWHAEADTLGLFLEERCTLADSLRASAAALYDAYRSWVSAEGQRSPMSSTAFGRKITARDGISKEHSRSGSIYRGIGLLCSNPEPAV